MIQCVKALNCATSLRILRYGRHGLDAALLWPDALNPLTIFSAPKKKESCWRLFVDPSREHANGKAGTGRNALSCVCCSARAGACLHDSKSVRVVRAPDRTRKCALRDSKIRKNERMFAVNICMHSLRLFIPPRLQELNFQYYFALLNKGHFSA